MPGMAQVDPETLRSTSVFAALTSEQLVRLTEAAKETDHAAGDPLAEEGGVGHRFHLLLEGAAVVERGGEKVAEIGAGDFVGEIALLGGGRSTATVRCTQPSRALTLGREEFWTVLEEEPAIALRILEVVCRRLAQELRGDPRANL